jgi:[histone H3]-lysine4 N-trimethyltransferase MLL1
MNGNCSSMSGLYGTTSFSSNASNLSSNSSISTSMTSLNQYMNESDDILYENFYGCARFEPYSTRSEYDMFSWLASRHRLAPMPVHIQSNNEEIILR